MSTTLECLPVDLDVGGPRWAAITEAKQAAVELSDSLRRGTLTFAGLEAYMSTRYRSTGAEESGNDTVGLRQLADILGVSWRYIQTLRRRNVLDPLVADGLAGRLRVHPAEVWPDWWDA